MLTRKQRFILHAFILVTSLVSYLLLIQQNREFHFFGDGTYKWTQLNDLNESQGFNIECRYPAKQIDPDFKFLKTSGVVSIQNGKCYYLYPFALSFINLFSFKLAGNWGIIFQQHLICLLILYLTWALGSMMKMSFINLLYSLILLRFGTGMIVAVNDLEEHLISVLLYLGATYLVLRSPCPPNLILGGILVGLNFLIRPETGILALVFPIATFFINFNKDKEITIQGKLLNSFLVALSAVFTLGFAFYLNYNLVGHILGIKAFDPIHHVTLIERLEGLVGHTFFHGVLLTNPIFLQMPILAFLFTYIFQKNQKVETNCTIKFTLVNLLSLPILLLISPPHPTLYLGFRYGLFLYPIMILLSMRLFDFDKLYRLKRIKYIIINAGIIWSIVLGVFFLSLSLKIYNDYLKVYSDLNKIERDVTIALDTITLQGLSDKLTEKPTIILKTNDDMQLVLVRLSKEPESKKILIVRSKLNPVSFEHNYRSFGFGIVSHGETDEIVYTILKKR